MANFWEQQPQMTPYKPSPFAAAGNLLAGIFGGYQQGKQQKEENIFLKKQREFAQWQMEREKQLAIAQDEFAKLQKSAVEMSNEEAKKKLELFEYITTLESTQDPKKALPLAPDWLKKQFEVSASIIKPPEAKQVTGIFGVEGEPMLPPQMQKQAMVTGETLQTGEGGVPFSFAAPQPQPTTETVFTPPTAVAREARPGYELFSSDGKTYETPINYEMQRNIFTDQLAKMQLEQQTLANTTEKLSYSLTVAGLPDQIATPIANYAANAILAGRPEAEVMNEIEGRLSRYSAQGITGLLEPTTIYNMGLDAADQARQASQMEYTKMMLPYTMEKPGSGRLTGKPQDRMYENTLGIIGMPTLAATAQGAVGANTGMSENSCAKTVGDIINASLGTNYNWSLSVDGLEHELVSRGFTEVKWGDAQPGDIIISKPKGDGHAGEGVDHTAVLSSFIQSDGSFSMISGRGSTVSQEGWNTSIYKNMRVYRAPGGAEKPKDLSSTDITRILDKEFGDIGGAKAILTPEQLVSYKNQLTTLGDQLERAKNIPGYPIRVIQEQYDRVKALLDNHERVQARWSELASTGSVPDEASGVTSLLDMF